MERNFYTDDFEELLKEKADQYKMYPSDKVWNGIQSSLHSKRKWYWIGFALLLSGVSYYAIEALLAPPARSQNSQVKVAASSVPAENVLLSAPNGKTPKALVIPLSSNRNADYDQPRSNKLDQPFYGVFEIDRSYADLEPGATAKVVDMLTLARIPVLVNPSLIAQRSLFTGARSYQAPILAERIVALPGSRRAASAAGDPSGLATTTYPDETFTHVRFPLEQEPAAEDLKKINWLQEYASTEFIIPRLKWFSWQLSFAPTINYRKLSTSKRAGNQYMVKNIPMALNVTGDIENLVNHKPAIGFELGSHLRFAANRTVTVKAGVQFNYARYAIEAFSAPTSDVATITLNSVGGARVDSLISYSNISNFGGNSVKDIQNQYFQLSAPIGLEVKLIDGKRLRFHVAGTIQPTYLMNRNTYLITTDYQSYTHEPSLVRRWNVNTSAEAFVSYNTGGITWQVGPQFRYQLLSSYSSQYPIRENLMEYGVKIGVSKTLK